MTTSFLHKILSRLKSGDARSIHLNALPANFARLDIYDLINIAPSLHLQFLELLLTKETFQFSITINPTDFSKLENEQKKIIQKIIKRLNHLDYQEKEEFAEYGFTSFGFGYPLLIKRDPNNREKILKAPLLIWYLNIEKDTRKNNTWTISRNEDQPLIFNELLKSHFESIEKIKTDELELLIEDDFLNEKQLNIFCEKLLSKLNIPFQAAENIATILPCTNKETIENITKETAWIRWSGVFGLYKMQKQSIIKDVENLINSESDGESESANTRTFFEGEVLSPIELDPSQENVLQQLKTHHELIIQGPPGTGKSQTLTALITQALLNKQKILVVCEKRTAMEVLFNNLKQQNLHHLCALIEDVYIDRKKIVENVRQQIELTEQPIIRFRNNEYELLRTKFLTLQEELNHRINFTKTEIFGDDNWLELLTKSIELNKDSSILEKANSINKHVRNNDYNFNFVEYNLLLEKIKIANELFLKVDKNAFVFDTIPNHYFTQNNDGENLNTEIILIKSSASMLLSHFIEPNLKLHKHNFDKQTGFTAFKVSLLSIFDNKYKNIITQKEDTKRELTILINYIAKGELVKSDLSLNDINKKINNALPKIEKIYQNIGEYAKQLNHLKDYFNYKKFILQQDLKTQNIVKALANTGTSDWQSIFTIYYFNQTILKNAIENGIKDDTQKLFDDLKETDNLFKQKLSEKINFSWNEIAQNTIKTKDLSEIKYLYNQRKNKQFSSKNSLRKIIHHDIAFFTKLFPVIMVNPTVATSILPLQKDLFDVIILDEASQLRIEDTFTSLYRGKIKIISGDKHQMPPSNYFGNETIFWNEDDDNEVENYLAESKSLLEFADDANYKNSYLDFHYRSLHPNLIQFSNYAFYQSRLIPLPEKKAYASLFYNQIDGVYSNGINQKEAIAIVDFIFNIEKINDEYPSIGIATFNIFQRDLIFDLLYEHAYADNNKNELLQTLLTKGLFVKNLENIQGDERDVMILSTTFGKNEEGKFKQLFGPISQEKGYQLLNVIITRAKHSLHLFTSIPETFFMHFEDELAQKGNIGKSIFYAYLSYVKACSENNKTQIQYLKNSLQKNNQPINKTISIISNSIFKQTVFKHLHKKFGSQVLQNYALGGFILDIVFVKDNRVILHIDFENTQNYHPEISYRIKIHQEKTIATYGIKTYHLWSYNWWKDAEKEIENITNQL
ncbi:MAG: DUF4011 domain-containing protein [Chitinophagales bacterium]|nr:DUF4011 domain-containing protein [Chitinophagales bacterium]